TDIDEDEQIEIVQELYSLFITEKKSESFLAVISKAKPFIGIEYLLKLLSNKNLNMKKKYYDQVIFGLDSSYSKFIDEKGDPEDLHFVHNFDIKNILEDLISNCSTDMKDAAKRLKKKYINT
ncbi:MAG: hypothetical protein PVI26_13100, partial [Chitinispirillia bacterium]